MSSLTDLTERLRGLIPLGIDHVVLYDEDATKIALALSGEVHGSVSAAHERTGRDLYYVLQDLEPDFAHLRTGALIRTVLRLPDGAVFYYMVEPGIHLYGATAAVEQIEELDESIAEIVNDLRTVVRYSPLDFGSYRSRRLTSELPPTARETVPAQAAPDTSGAPRTAPAWPGRGGDDEGTSVLAALRRALRTDGLHYLAYYPHPSSPEVIDIFEQPDLQKFFRSATPDHRRTRYRRMGALLPSVIHRMNESLRAVMRGELVRVVLDVEQGAVYFHTLPGSRFLVGVTLDQSRVAESDDQITRTVRELEALA